MENSKSLFALEVDSIGKSHLRDAAKWAKFLAIVGFIALALILIFSVVAAIIIQNRIDRDFGNPNNNVGEIAGTIIGASFVLIICFFPFYFLLQFANKMQAAIAADDTASLSESFKNLKKTLRYVGVVTIIFLALFVIGTLSTLSGL